MILHALLCQPSANFTYVIADPASLDAAVIDPSFQADAVLELVSRLGLRVRYVLNTHGHRDHTSGNDAVLKATDAKLFPRDEQVPHGGELSVGALRVRVLHTPGHTPDGVCFLVQGTVFTGDTLFVGECGRVDLPGGDASVLYDSLFGVLLGLPDDTRVMPGHDYGSSPTSTIGQERASNYVLKPRTRQEFLRFMTQP